MIENMLRDYSMAYGLHYVALRYFNAAGASLLGNIGEDHNPETHLIPLTIQPLWVSAMLFPSLVRTTTPLTARASGTTSM